MVDEKGITVVYVIQIDGREIFAVISVKEIFKRVTIARIASILWLCNYTSITRKVQKLLQINEAELFLTTKLV